jgi:hypothetical protein
LRYAVRELDRDGDLSYTGRMLGHRRFGCHRQPGDRQSMPGEISVRVVSDARGQAGDKELRRRGSCVRASGPDGLVHVHKVISNGDLEEVALFVTHSNGAKLMVTFGSHTP